MSHKIYRRNGPLHPQDARDLLTAARWERCGRGAKGITFAYEDYRGIIAYLLGEDDQPIAEAWFDSNGRPHFKELIEHTDEMVEPHS